MIVCVRTRRVLLLDVGEDSGDQFFRQHLGLVEFGSFRVQEERRCAGGIPELLLGELPDGAEYPLDCLHRLFMSGEDGLGAEKRLAFVSRAPSDREGPVLARLARLIGEDLEVVRVREDLEGCHHSYAHSTHNLSIKDLGNLFHLRYYAPGENLQTLPNTNS